MDTLEQPTARTPTARTIAAIVVAAGKGLRAGGAVPKQFAQWRGKPLVRHCVEAFAAARIDPIIVAIPQGWEDVAAAAVDGIAGVKFVIGGTTRQESVRHALEVLDGRDVKLVLIHDAARPILPSGVIAGIVRALEDNLAVIPALPVVDSMIRGVAGLRAETVPRDELYHVQTPQGFDYSAILNAHRVWQGAPDAGDDAQVAVAAGMQVALIAGDANLRKVTFAADLQELSMNRPPRIGMGFDVHRLVEGEELWLCGVKVPHDKGLSGHSDADVAIHALVDALLGAVAAGDIGDHFPPSDAQWKGASSDRFLAHAAQVVAQAGYRIANVDVTIICEAPKIGPHKLMMREVLAQILGIDLAAISVKATTTERLGSTGRGEGIAAQAVVSVFAD